MTPEVFFKNLDLTAIVRKSTEKEKPVKLEEGDAEKLCLLWSSIFVTLVAKKIS